MLIQRQSSKGKFSIMFLFLIEFDNFKGKCKIFLPSKIKICFVLLIEAKVKILFFCKMIFLFSEEKFLFLFNKCLFFGESNNLKTFLSIKLLFFFFVV